MSNMLKTVNHVVHLSIKIQRSEFIAFLYPVKSVEEIKAVIAEHNNKYKDANHNCYAYILGNKQETQYYSDQGEPSGTAGKPILNTLLKHHLTNVIGIVTRFFGGIKLGVRGLIDAYSQSMEELIGSTILTDFFPTLEIKVECEYHNLENLKHLLKQNMAELVAESFTEKIIAKIVYPIDKDEDMQNLISDLTGRELLTIINRE